MTQLKIYLAQINNKVGDLSANTKKILEELIKAEASNADLAVFCEMTLTGYPCEDLWQRKDFLEESNKKMQEIIAATKSLKCAILLGAPYLSLNRSKKEIINNAAFLIENGEIKKIIRKKNLPNYGVFDEKRYFEPDNILSFVEFRNQTLAIMICEDIWDEKNIYLLQEQVFDAIISINASPYSSNKHKHRQDIAENVVRKIKKPLIYVNQVGGQDSLVFDGSSFVLNEKGEVVLALKEFLEDAAIIYLQKGFIEAEKISTPLFGDHAKALPNQAFQHFGAEESYKISRNYSACILGLRDYLYKNNFNKAVLGMSGGIDSALVAAIAVDALGEENVQLYALPSRFNAESSMIDAKECAKNLNLNLEVISIENAFTILVATLYDYCGETSNNKGAGLARENLQARIRGNILMTISNATGALLLSTGNKSELATGYATLYGDMCGAFNPIKDLYKTQVYQLVKWRNNNVPTISSYKKTAIIPQNIIIKEPTAELRDNQKDSDSLPSYEILDKILFALIEEQKSILEIVKLGFNKELVERIANLLYGSEYKRKQAVIGAKISDKSFDKDRRYPIASGFKA